MKFGIENLKLLLSVIFSFVTVGDKMGHENSWATRASHLFGFFPKLMTLGSIKWALLDDEIKDIDGEEREALTAHIKKEFDIIDDKLEVTIEKGLSLAASLGSTVKTVSEFIEEIKGYFKK